MKRWRDPLQELGVRPTYRTLRVLAAVGLGLVVLDREINVENPVPAVAASPAPVAKRTATRRVRARVTLSIKPRRVGVDGRVRFSYG